MIFLFLKGKVLRCVFLILVDDYVHITHVCIQGYFNVQFFYLVNVWKTLYAHLGSAKK